MRRSTRNLWPALAVLALGAVAATLGHRTAGASHGGVSAHFGGIDASPRTQPVLTVFNAQDVLDPIDIDVVLRDTEGNVLKELEDVLELGTFQSGSVNLWDALREGLARRERPYTGLLAVEVHSDSAAFAEGAVMVHVTEFFANPRRPRAAILFHPLFVAAE